MFQNYDYFLAIATAGSLSRAAEKLFLTQPALSKYLKRLEQDLEIELFSRDGSTLTLTYAGKQYLEAVKRIKNEESHLEHMFREIRNATRSELSIGVSRWRSVYVLSKFLPNFQVSYPKIEISVDVQNSGIILSDLKTNKLDVGILGEWYVKDASDLYAHKIYTERLLIAANENHPLVCKLCANGAFDDYSIADGRYPEISISMLVNESFLFLNKNMSESRHILAYLESAGIYPNISKHAPNVNSLLFGVSCSNNFAFIPESGVAVNAIPKQVVFLSCNDNALTHNIMAVTSLSIDNAPALQAAITVLQNVFSSRDE